MVAEIEETDEIMATVCVNKKHGLPGYSSVGHCVELSFKTTLKTAVMDIQRFTAICQAQVDEHIDNQVAAELPDPEPLPERPRPSYQTPEPVAATNGHTSNGNGYASSNGSTRPYGKTSKRSYGAATASVPTTGMKLWDWALEHNAKDVITAWAKRETELDPRKWANWPAEAVKDAYQFAIEQRN